MKKVGFIDYYLDEWHANNYPEFLKNRSNGEYQVCFAYGQIDSPIGGMTNKEWSEKYGILLCDTAEEVIEKSDVLIVLSPDNPEMHEELCELPLESGKLVYIDKTFAPDRATAVRIFDYADKHNTKCYSSSALGFSSELDEIDITDIDTIFSEGPGPFKIYVIHQLEMIVRLMNCRATKVMYTGNEAHPALVIEFEDGRLCHLIHREDDAHSFQLTIADKNNDARKITIESDYFGLFIDALIKFFDCGVVPVEHKRTIEVIGIREVAMKAMNTPFSWIEI